MIEASHAVLLHDRRIGSILQRGDVARFVFTDGYWEDPDRNVLGLWFEDDPRRSPKAASRLPPWFSNLLPEGYLRSWIAHAQGVSADRELQLLLRIGRDLPGAVQVIAADHEQFDPALLADSGSFTLGGTSEENQWKFSLAGVSLKFSMLKKKERFTIPSSNTLGDWIVKLPDPHYPQVPNNEYATMKLACSVGINTPEIALVHRDELSVLPDHVWPGGEEWAYTVSRFDRTPTGQRIHIEDLAQVRGFYDDAKYCGSFETVAALLYRGYDRESLHEFVRRLTFNLLIGNGDAHLKNWSLIYPNKRVPAISPAYDLVSTGPYAATHAPDDFGLTFGGTKVMERIKRYDFVQLQHRLGVESVDIVDILDKTIESFVNSWRNGAAENFPWFVSQWIEDHSTRIISNLSPR
ncbi:type II toxin-antitoxin system HipA family toxin [Mycobacteroides abscessus]|uniref:type II toxin-antitoxin system HipA family toxin n=1 Tax=Mycobacteroides abscessus TaxID=36809 RepID=UPI0009A7CB4C|nr:type II toxin-antitoxin system HipA family toxin [Mycobacteroides abscessus]MBN7496729.1 type II toxin-antitoxin system HipA family toxin [Mycobacteroides abscessus subsp. abscessus]MDM2078814.1 type II toxin-antitoxin system HipA family toxin [Mycobacteroides abscessus]MDM2084600.1 type II toxin-antitoxin system HipA family toxin [Mycobacteroides abscessus]MDM3901835.1 type II toxin-antitoxin system HipA family toxin [Mycobacteroides abscessus]RIU24629.1 type II toxin-antitoxin system HipA